MTRSASEIMEGYLARLRVELTAAGAPDTDDLVAEIRSLLIEAAGDDPTAAATEIARLGEPGELAGGILAERGLDASTGMPSGVWWRLGIAAPIDIAIGLALPMAAALPILYAVAWFGEPRIAGIAVGIALGLIVLAWPFFIWRPWRRGGRALSPGMNLTGLAVVRAPGFWRLVLIDDLAALGLAPRRRFADAIVVTLVAAVLLSAVAFVGLNVGRSWLAAAAISAEFSARTDGDGVAPGAEFEDVIGQVYSGLMGATEPETSAAAQVVASQSVDMLRPLWLRIANERITAARIVGAPVQIAPGVYRFEVQEFRGDGSPGSVRVGSSTFTVGRREWLTVGGVGRDWVVVDIALGTGGSK